MSNKKYEKAKEKVLIIKAIVEKYGINQWYTEKGKLIANGNNDREAQKDAVGVIKNNKKELLGSNVIYVKVIFHEDKKTLMNKAEGGIEVRIAIYTIKTVLGKISLQLRDDTHSLVHIFYNYKHLDDFELSQLKKLAKMVLDNKLKTKIFSGYQFHKLK